MRILITGAWKCSEREIEKIEQLGHKVIFMQNEADELECDASSIEGVICNGLFLHHPIEDFTSLKYIQLTSAGFDRVPMEYVAQKGIEIHNARGVYSVPMAEFALCGVLRIYKESRFFEKNQREKKWEKHRGLRELCGKTVCVVGCGSVGDECAKRFGVFGCRVIGVDVKESQNALYESVLPLCDIEKGLKKADVVLLTLPLTDKTYRMIDREKFDVMKDGAVLVNISRGAVVDTAAMTDALKEKLGGAVLDVFEEEPLSPTSPLWSMENVIVTPHNSFVGDGNAQRLATLIYKNLECAEK